MAYRCISEIYKHERPYKSKFGDDRLNDITILFRQQVEAGKFDFRVAYSVLMNREFVVGCGLLMSIAIIIA